MLLQTQLPASMSQKSKPFCLMCRLLVTFMLFWLPASSQYAFEDLTAQLRKSQKQLGNKAVTMVFKDDSLIYKNEIGEDFNAKTSAPVETLGQWLAVATIMTFVDQGKLRLDDPVSKYLPIFSSYAKSYLTIRHCLSNTTGIESEKPKLGKILGGRKKYNTLEEEVNAIAAKEISNNPEKEFHYGNLGINIAARVVEVIGKKSFDRLAQERITRPLKMRATSFTDENGGAINPAVGARSSANDYLNFLVMILNNGKFEGKQVISENSLMEMQKQHFAGLPVAYKPVEATGFDFGLGSWIEARNPEEKPVVIGFPGSTGSWAMVDKCRKYAAIIFVKNAADDISQQVYLNLKAAIDEQVKSSCN
ncbi:MAG: class A beta-lactamase-related serine hydrolase [Chitinophagaceae bacterium]|nr:MAG: class A beta-lactamase-related serine hydrolase [Chitinophagaceae bacterium]